MKKIEISFEVSKYIDEDTECAVPGFVEVETLVNGKGWLLDSPVSYTSEAILRSKLSSIRAGMDRAKKFPQEIVETFGVNPLDLLTALDYKSAEIAFSK